MTLKHFPASHLPFPLLPRATLSSAPGRTRRSAMTLFEVVVSLAIFLFALTAITQLMSLGSGNIMEADVRSHGALLCQSKMAEVVAGAQTLGSTGFASYQSNANPGWEWMVECNEDGEYPGLWEVQVSVKRDVPGRGSVSVSLSQMVMDPSKKGSTLDAPIPSMATTGSN